MSSKISKNAIQLTRGDTFPALVQILKDGVEYIPEPGDKVRFALKHDKMTPGKKEFTDPEPLILKDIPTDTMILELEPEDTQGLDFGKYKYDIEITFADGTVDTFIADEDFKITPEVH